MFTFFFVPFFPFFFQVFLSELKQNSQLGQHGKKLHTYACRYIGKKKHLYSLCLCAPMCVWLFDSHAIHCNGTFNTLKPSCGIYKFCLSLSSLPSHTHIPLCFSFTVSILKSIRTSSSSCSCSAFHM